MTTRAAVLTQMEAAAKESGSERTRSHLALARAAWLIETRKWGEAKAPVPAKGLPKDAAIADLFAIGFAALRSGNRAAGSAALQQMAALMESAPVNMAPVKPTGAPGTKPLAPGVTPVAPATGPRAVPAPGTTPGTGTSTKPLAPQAPGHEAHAGQAAVGLPTAGAGGDLRVPQVMALQLEALLLFSEGRREEALVLARQGAVVEAGLPFEFGPPVPVKPVNEQVGEMLMDLRRPKEAMEAFELSLKRNPKRALSPARSRPRRDGGQRHSHRPARLRGAARDLEEGGQDAARAERDRRSQTAIVGHPFRGASPRARARVQRGNSVLWNAAMRQAFCCCTSTSVNSELCVPANGPIGAFNSVLTCATATPGATGRAESNS